MAAFYHVNDEIWSFIITLLATSANGAMDLVCFAATSKNFRRLTRNTALLKVVNFERISVDDYWAHRHLKDLLCLCARAGNQAAQSMLGKALLHNDAFFWVMILEHDTPLRHQRLVRRFIHDASEEDLSIMRVPLCSYVISFLGYHDAYNSGLLFSIAEMCSFFLEKRVNVVQVVPSEPLFGVDVALDWLTPPSGRVHRAIVLLLFDRLFGILE